MAAEACKEAENKGADIAVFPEIRRIGYQFSHDKGKLQGQALILDSRFIKRCSEAAERLDMAIAVMFLGRNDPRPGNTVCLFGRHGFLQYRYSKVHICDFAGGNDECVHDAGDEFFAEDLDPRESINLAGSIICYDWKFPGCARVLMLEGAELVLVRDAYPLEVNRL